MNKKVFYLFAFLLLFMRVSAIEVNGVEELQTAVSASEPEISIGPGFPTDLTDLIELIVSGNQDITVDGNNRELFPRVGSQHFRITGDGSGRLLLKNFHFTGLLDESYMEGEEPTWSAGEAVEGGGIHAYLSNGRLQFENCVFKRINGGAIYVFETKELVIENCSFLSNFSLDKGAAISRENVSLKISRSTFAYNVKNDTKPNALYGEQSCLK